MVAHGNHYDFDLSEDYTLADLVARKRVLSRPKIIALCAPVPYPHWFRDASLEKMLSEAIVLSLSQGMPDFYDPADAIHSRMQSMLPLWMIDLADEMVVLNIDGAMDPAMMQEYQYASDQRKPLHFLMNACGQCNRWVLTSEIPDGIHAGCPVSRR